MAQTTTAQVSSPGSSIEEAAAVIGIVTDEEEATRKATTRSATKAAAAAAANKKEDDDNDNDELPETQDENVQEEKKDEAPAPPAKKKDYSNWPLKGIREPHANDVLFGRGGGTNHHPGNKRYRKMVEDRKVDYINSKRLDKPLVALDIIKEWRSQEPPGRFLKIDEKTGLWSDVGDKKAREKTSQALREKAPIIRKQQEDEIKAQERKEKGLPPEESDEETTEPLQQPAPDRPKPVMARDTTFGVEYIDPDQTVTLDGFSWQEGIGETQRSSMKPTPPPPPPPPPTQYPPSGSREASYSNGAPAAPPHPGHYRYGSHGGMPPPSGSFTTPTASTDERQYQYAAHGRYESWGSVPPAPPAPIGYMHPVPSWAEREHSLGQFPLPHASIGHPASYTTFDPRAVSGVYPGHPHSPHTPPSPYPPPYNYSSGYPGSRPTSYGPPPPPPPPPPPSASSPTRPPYAIDPSVASTWSGQPEREIIKTLSGEEAERNNRGAVDRRISPSLNQPLLGVKPDIVKRATSNQNETFETKPDLISGAVKRAALNRDSSNAANRLKELCFPGQFKNGKFDVAKEVKELSEDMGRSTFSVTKGSPERVSTLDLLPPIQGSVSEESTPSQPKPARPSALEERTTTMDAIAASFEHEDTVTLSRVDSVGPIDLPRPGAWGFSDRLTTTDLMQMVNEPIPDDDPELISGRRQEL